MTPRRTPLKRSFKMPNSGDSGLNSAFAEIPLQGVSSSVLTSQASGGRKSSEKCQEGSEGQLGRQTIINRASGQAAMEISLDM